jgi:hypothetical protein
VSQQILTLAFGVAFIFLGLAARLGTWKSWYWRTRGSVYGYAPLGLAFLMYASRDRLLPLFGPYPVLFQSLLALLLLCGLWWSTRPPSFVKPAWVRWVESYPKKAYDAMASAAKDGEAWEPHVASPETLQAWVKEVLARKRNRRGKP